MERCLLSITALGVLCYLIINYSQIKTACMNVLKMLLVALCPVLLTLSCEKQVTTPHEHNHELIGHDCEDELTEISDPSNTVKEGELLLEEVLEEMSLARYSQEQLDSVAGYLIEVEGYAKKKMDIQPWGITYDGDLGVPVDQILELLRSDGNMKNYYRQWSLITKTSSVRVATVANGSLKLNSDWFAATNTATSKWNNLNGNLNFSRRHYSGFYPQINNLVWILPIDFTAYSSLPDLAVAKTQLLKFANGYPSRWIAINTSHPFYGTWNANQRKQIMMHEIGHAIGFLHVDSGQEALITGLPSVCSGVGNNDDSIMRAVNNSSQNHNFTYCDEEAYYELY